MSYENFDQVIDGLGLRREIDSLSEDREFRDLAALYVKLSEQYPNIKELRIRAIMALRGANAWSDAEELAGHALADNPDDLTFALTHAHVAYAMLKFDVAVQRFQKIRKLFDPRLHHSSAATILDEFTCYDQMADYESARKLIDSSLGILQLYAANTFSGRFDIFEIYSVVKASKRQQFAEWSKTAVQPAHRPAYLMRLKAFNENQSWISRRSVGVNIVSVGQNCLPWVLINRWGFRPNSSSISPFGPFDYLPMIEDYAAKSIEGGLSNILDENATYVGKLPNKTPILLNRDLGGVFFFHEKGPWWGENDWERLYSTYRQRIRQFLSTIQSSPTLYVFCLCGNGNPERLVEAFESKLSHPNARLLILNVLKEPVSLEKAAPNISLLNIAYPEDYDWNHFEHYSAPAGYEFETKIAQAIRDELVKFEQEKKRETTKVRLLKFLSRTTGASFS